MLGGRLPDEGVQVVDRGLSLAGEVLGDEQGEVPVGALLGHPHVSQLVLRVDHGNPLGAHLGDQTGSIEDPPSDRAPLGHQVGALVLVEFVVVDDRVFEQSAGEPPAQRLVAQFVALSDRLGGQFGEPAGEGRGVHRGRPAGTGKQYAQHRSAHVVEHVDSSRQVGILVPGDPGEHSPSEQQPDHRD